MIDKWKMRRRSCSTIYTHPDILYQIIIDNSRLTITLNDRQFDSVEAAKAYAERMYL